MIVLRVMMRIQYTGGAFQNLRKCRSVNKARFKSLALVSNTGANKTRLMGSGKTRKILRRLGNPLKESLLTLPRALTEAQKSIISCNLTDKRKKVQRRKMVRRTSSNLTGLTVASKDKRMAKMRLKSLQEKRKNSSTNLDSKLGELGLSLMAVKLSSQIEK